MSFSVDAVLPLRELKRRYLAWVLAQTKNNKSEAARRLGMDRSSFTRMLRESIPRGAASPELRAPLLADGGTNPARGGT